ncbi:hypothetical protein [Zobellia uliginosa]|uniref:hypothetical protein n=1 Tax=Zobellia uliginosa TaxID=143224 RepID=UPI001C069110|nr:hypothetical protein [Zobellia uliginosa]MBU2948597.1 hypothetical protein [Zobellia uliginosa]
MKNLYYLLLVLVFFGCSSKDDGPESAPTEPENKTAKVNIDKLVGTTSENGGKATFTFTLSTTPLNDVTIPISGYDDTEGEGPSSITLTPENWQTGVTLTIEGINDDEFDGNVTYTLVTGSINSTDPDYNPIKGEAIDDLSITNSGDDLKTSIDKESKIDNGGGFKNNSSPRNHFYTFVNNTPNTRISIIVKAKSEDAKVDIMLFKGENYNSTLESDKSYKSTEDSIEHLLTETGTYTVVITAEKEIETSYSLSFLANQEIKELTPTVNSVETVSGVWENAGGYDNYLSPSNRMFNFEVTKENTYVDILLNSDSQDVKGKIIVLKDNNGEYAQVTSSLNYDVKKEISEFLITEPGNYSIVATAAEYGNGGFSLQLFGMNNSISTITAEKTDVLTQEGNFEPSGGGIMTPYSPLGKAYKFSTVNDNTIIDIVAESNNSEASLNYYLYKLTQGEKKLVFQATKTRLTVKPKMSTFSKILPEMGDYELVVTSETESTGTFEVTLSSKPESVVNFVEIPSITFKQNSVLEIDGDVFDPYNDKAEVWEFNTLKPNTYLDILIDTYSDTVKANFYIFKVEGSEKKQILRKWGSRLSLKSKSEERAFLLDKIGTYQIIITTEEDSSGNYDISISSRTGYISNPEKVN